MKKRFFVLVACLMAVSLPCAADDLMTIYREALSNDVQLSSAVNSLKAREEIVPQSRAQLLPRVDLNAGSSYNGRDARGTDEQNYNSHSYDFKLKQPLFDAQRWYQLGAANAQYDQAQAQIAAAQQEFIVRVAETYFDVLKAQDTLTAAKAQEVATKNQLDQAIERFKVGLIAITDQYEAQAGYDLARAERIANESELAVAYEALATLTMKRYETLSILQDKLPIEKAKPEKVDDWLAMALTTSPELKAAQANAQASEQQLSQARAGHLPTVDLIADKIYNKTGSNTAIISDQTNQDIIGVEFKMPLFEGGGTQSKIREAAYNNLASKDKAEFIKRTLAQKINSYYSVVNNDVEKVKARLEATKSSASALEATQAGYEVGTRNIVEVLQVTKTYYASQRDYAISRYEYIINTLKLKQAAGILTENDIKELNEWLTSKPSNPSTTNNAPNTKKEIIQKNKQPT